MAEPGDVVEAVLLPTQFQARPCSMRPEIEEIHTQGDDISLKMNLSRNECEVCEQVSLMLAATRYSDSNSNSNTQTYILSSTHNYKLHDPSTSN